MTKIYEINRDIEDLLEQRYNCFDLETGELIEGKEKELEYIDSQLGQKQNQKDENKTRFLNQRGNDLVSIDGVNKEIERLKNLKTKLENKVKTSEKVISFLFGDFDKKILFNNFEIGYSKSEAIIFTDENKIPEKYKTKEIKEIIKISRNDIKEDIKQGLEVPGAILEKRKNFYIN